MDKIDRIKRIVESSLNTSFGDELSINEVVILPTQKYDEEVREWVPDSYTLFLSLKRNGTTEKPPDFLHFESQGNFVDVRKVTNFLESLLGFECVVDFV
jgi:superfamily I DNA and/or RNA helicase